MIPVLYQFKFETPGMQALLYVLAAALVLYIAFAGWRGASGQSMPLTVSGGALATHERIKSRQADYKPPTQQEKLQRALMFGGGAVVLALLGLHYALPPTVSLPFFGPSKGEGIPIHTYGVLLASGFILAVTLAGELARREWRGEEGENKRDQVMDLAFWVLIGGIVGSRVLFIITKWEDYAAHPAEIFSLGGGLVFYGGLIGASTAAFIYCRKYQIDFLRLADLALPTVSLGQCLGRLGCFSAGCCFGRISSAAMKFGVHFPGPLAKNLFGQVGGTPSMAYSELTTDSHWVIESTGQVFHQAVPGAVRISDWVNAHATTLPLHPTQLYESVGQFTLLVAFLVLRRYRRFKGQITGMWLMAYAVLRTTVELFRGDYIRGTLNKWLNDVGATALADKVPLEAWYNISTSQVISLCMFTAGAIIVYRGARPLWQAQAVAQAAAA